VVRRWGPRPVVRNKAAELVDAGYTATGEKITDAAICRQLYPTASSARPVPRKPITSEILECQLNAVRREDYAQLLTDGEFARLTSIFPESVCDYSRPGVGHAPLSDTCYHFRATTSMTNTTN
jgi:hypothetical protein